MQNLGVIEEFLEFLLIIKGIYLSPVFEIREPPESASKRLFLSCFLLFCVVST